jgi:hypothetical protein
MVMTVFSNKVSILADFWVGYSDDPTFSKFIEINSSGFPLSHLIKYDYVLLTDKGEELINNLWIDFLEYLDVEDTGFEDLTEIYFVE